MLAFAFVLAGLGGLLVWSGITDADGGPVGLLGTVLRGEALPKLKTPATPIATPTGSGTKSPTGSGTKSPTSQTPTPTGGGSGRGAAIVAAANAELGKPYVYGANGPGMFDCSGLVFYVLNKVGIRVADDTADGYRRRYPKVSSPQPGDLVAFGVPSHHIGIYIGGGRMIDAPHTGAVVRVDSLAGRSGPITYVRPW